MRPLVKLEIEIFNSVHKIYYTYFNNKPIVDLNTDNILIGKYQDSIWYYIFGNSYDGFAVFNRVYINKDLFKSPEDIALLAHEFVHIIQFKQKPIYTLFKILWERFFYGNKKVYNTKGTLEFEARFIQLIFLVY